MAGDNNSDAIYAAAQFVSIFSSLSTKSKEGLIEIVKSELVDDHFESELLRIYKETKGRNQFECRHAVLIEDFVANFKLENFSKSFQDRWVSMQPYTLDFGSSKLIIGGRPYTAVDQLIATLDHFDEVGVFMAERFGLGRELQLNTSELKDIFGEWSAADLVINALVDLSKNCEVGSRAYVFVKNLVERIGLGALQEETRLAYLEVFPGAN
jgi:hypothetical protein